MADQSSELWRAARKQISEYEHKSSELALVLQTEKEALEGVLKEVQSLASEKAANLSKAEEVEGRARQAKEQLATLRGQADKAAEESGVLMKHLELFHDSKRELTAQLEQDRQRYGAYITQLTTQLEQYRRYLAAAQAEAAAEA